MLKRLLGLVLAGMAVSGVLADEEDFVLTVEPEDVAYLKSGKIEVQAGNVCNSPDFWSFTKRKAGTFLIKTPHGEYIFARYHGNLPEKYPKLKSLRVIKDEERVKRIEMLSEPFEDGKWQCSVGLEVRKGFPIVFVDSRVRNLQEGAKEGGYFCWSFKMPSNKYISSIAEEEISKDWQSVKGEEWVYFPGENGGLGLVENNKLPGCFINFCFQGKALYGNIARTPQEGDQPINKIRFLIFGATDATQVKGIYNIIKETNLFPSLWLD